MVKTEKMPIRTSSKWAFFLSVWEILGVSDLSADSQNCVFCDAVKGAKFAY